MIIKVLIALSLFIIIFLAFRLFFGPEAKVTAGVGSLDTAQLEKTLQKILEAQGKMPTMSAGAGAVVDSAEAFKIAGGAGGGLVGGSAAAGASAVVAELESLKKELVEKEKQLAATKQEVAKAAGGSAGAAGASARVDENSSKLESRIKDLEARLAEYEIISEDIADLSFFKEENARLQSELAEKAGTTRVLGTPAAVEAPIVVAGMPAPAAEAPILVAESIVAAPAPSAPAMKMTPSDNDLMKEFEKAVQEQKGATGEAPPIKDSDENAQLMNQFENFVKKT